MTAESLYRRCERLYEWLEYAFEGTALVTVYTPEEWDTLDLNMTTDPCHYPFGFLAPRFDEDARDWRFGVCPQVVAESMDEILPAWEEVYLQAWLLHLLGHITEWQQDPEVIETVIEDSIRTKGPDTMRIMTKVQLDWLHRLAEQSN